MKASKDSKTENHNKNLIQCLSSCDMGSELIVIRVEAGQMAKNRLANLGIVPGAKIIKKKSAPFNGPVEIDVKGSSLVLGRGLAAKIIVNCGNSCKF
ncbi:MAG: ferrous iron transport protein A [Candidatus Lokiarchaeota archaeon]|nr:ferrous iron transport protein A [Candidatus Lokiarchaeota archaeon]